MLGKTNQILKKLVYAGIVAAVFLAGAAGKALSAPDSNSIVIDDIEFYVETDKSIYYLGENVQMLYRLTKLGPPSASILCHQAPPLNLVVLKDGKTVWMKVQDWWQWVGELQLFPQIPVEITSSWDMKDLNDVPVEPGTYDVLGVIYDCIGLPDVGVQITILPVPRTITVGLGAGYDFNTIQAAIDDSNDGDTIIVADGTYTGDGNRDIDFLGKAITLRSENGPENCIIDCQGSEADKHRGFYFHSGEDANSVLDGFTIRNGYKEYGGGIRCTGSSPHITNCVITDNVAPWVPGFPGYFSTPGGGIGSEVGSPIIENCIISNNTASDCGGGLYCYTRGDPRCSPTLRNCIITGNSANTAGAVYRCNGGITNCTIYNNSADLRGGGVYDCGATVTNCIIWGNGDDLYLSYATYSCIEDLDPGTGNIHVDPCFADLNNGDYHLKSEAGRWEPASESWIQDDVTSPCIDAGNPGCPLGDEPAPNGNRRNMGAYGGTAEASKSPDNWRSIADLTNDWVVDSNDLKVFVDYWLNMGECIPGDLNRNQSANSADFALLAMHWLRDENQ